MKKIDMKGMALGVVDFAFYVPALNFVFGEADTMEGVAIISISYSYFKIERGVLWCGN